MINAVPIIDKEFRSILVICKIKNCCEGEMGILKYCCKNNELKNKCKMVYDLK